MTPPPDFLMQKARNFCAYQERSIEDIRGKLSRWKASEETVEEIINKLKEENFLDEERFARAFAVGKLRNNQWGRNKIIYALKQKQIPDLYIQIGLGEIDDTEYINTLKGVLSSKKVTGHNDFVRQNKLVRYAVQKGFQADLAWKILKGGI